MAIVTEQDLMAATQFKQRGQLERALVAQRVRFFRGKGGCIWTTDTALDFALNLIAKDERATPDIEFED